MRQRLESMAEHTLLYSLFRKHSWLNCLSLVQFEARQCRPAPWVSSPFLGGAQRLRRYFFSYAR